MADTLNVDIFSLVKLPKIVPIVNLPHPVYNISLTEEEILQLIQMPNYNLYKAGTRDRVDGSTIDEYFPHGGGGGGTSDYRELTNKPSINNHTLRDNSSLEDIGALQLPQTGAIGDALTITQLNAQGKPSKLGPKTIQEFDPDKYKLEVNCVISE
jgi:hypothetical protein